jgi:hypothetical protein
VDKSREPPWALCAGYNRFGQLGLGLLPRGGDGAGEPLDPDAPVAPEVDEEMQQLMGEGWREKLRTMAADAGGLEVDLQNVPELREVPARPPVLPSLVLVRDPVLSEVLYH